MDRTVTLLVPTMNRPSFVARLLRYYAGQGFGGRIAIADSSNVDDAARTRQTAEALRSRLDVLHVTVPGLGLAVACQQLIDRVSTQYAAFLPDDDFLVPAALDRCVSFLSEHPEYAAAHGAGVTITLDSNQLHGRVVRCGYYPQPVIEADSAAQRLRDHLSNYTVSLFAVHRTTTLKAMYADVHVPQDTSFAAEVLPCCTTVIMGKVKELEGLYLVRQSHNLRLELPTMFDWVASPAWYSSYQATVASLARALAENGDLSAEAAHATVKEGFRQYVGLGLGLRRSWGRDAWVLGLARRAWAALQAVRPHPEARWTLPELLKPSSPDYADFQPIYSFLVVPPEGAGAQQPGH